MILALIGLAQAGEICPAPGLLPRAEPLSGYVCETLSEALSLCTTCDGQPLREAALVERGIERAALDAEVAAAAAAALTQERPIRTEITGMPGANYWVSQAGDGLDAAGLLHPELLRDLAGTTPVVGIPEPGTFVMWIPGDPDIDKVVAVGVRRIYEVAQQPTSDRIYRWHNGAWQVWGEVVTRSD